MRDSYKFADRLPDSQWHCECFKCHQCEAKLMGDIYFAHENNIYCGRHYGELLKNRCVACDEVYTFYFLRAFFLFVIIFSYNTHILHDTK